MSTIEKTFNDIWGVNRARNFPNSVMRYWSTITLGPLCLIFVFALTSGPRFEATRNSLADMPLLGNFVMALMPFVILSLLFALFYLAVPNTKVDWRAALVGGAVGGCLWQMNHLFSVLYASKVVTNSQIYGSLSMLPLLLIGLFTSWLILLFGAQVAYNFQNRRTYMQEIQCENVDQDRREFIALRLMTLIGQRFETEQSPPTIQQIADRLDVPPASSAGSSPRSNSPASSWKQTAAPTPDTLPPAPSTASPPWKCCAPCAIAAAMKWRPARNPNARSSARSTTASANPNPTPPATRPSPTSSLVPNGPTTPAEHFGDALRQRQTR